MLTLLTTLLTVGSSIAQVLNYRRDRICNEKITKMRQEFERDSLEKKKERMWRLIEKEQEQLLKWEAQKHKQRLDELENDIGSLLKVLAYNANINNWPLSVLPIVMKNQALGNLILNQEESITIHCIFTPSNCTNFNKYTYSIIEDLLEQFCNEYWSIISDHPILFYSGAWKTSNAPTEVQIDSMRTSLSNLPTLLITPYFRPDDGMLVWQLRMWGIDIINNDNTINDLYEFSFEGMQHIYTENDDYANPSIIDDFVKNIIPNIKCLIGYITDCYFWSTIGLSPRLPLLLTDKLVNSDKNPLFIQGHKEIYESFLYNREAEFTEQSMQNRLLNLLIGISPFWNEKEKKEKLESFFISYCSKHTGEKFITMKECLVLNNFYKGDLDLLKNFHKHYKNEELNQNFIDIISFLEATDADYYILESNDDDFLKKLSQAGNAVAQFRIAEKGLLSRYKKGTYYVINKEDTYYIHNVDDIAQAIKKAEKHYPNIMLQREIILNEIAPDLELSDEKLDKCVKIGVMSNEQKKEYLQQRRFKTKKNFTLYDGKITISFIIAKYRDITYYWWDLYNTSHKNKSLLASGLEFYPYLEGEESCILFSTRKGQLPLMQIFNIR